MSETTTPEMTTLEKVKEYLKSAGDEELGRVIARAKSRLNKLVGVDLDFEDPDIEQLLLDLCRYIHNNASEYFEENFKSEILRLQLDKAVEVMLSEG
jgi:chorismate mutase